MTTVVFWLGVTMALIGFGVLMLMAYRFLSQPCI
jgi:hypothetical protein